MSKTHWKRLINPDYIGAYSLEEGQDLTVTIESVRRDVVTGTGGKKEECTIAYEDEEIHIVSHKLPPELRITRIAYQRDMELEAKLIERCQIAQEYVREELFRIEAEHKGI